VEEDSLISFVVIAYNEERNISRTLDSIIALDGLGNHEIIVVNDGSSDTTATVLARIAADNRRVQLIDLSENRGRGFARNAGVSAARGSLIATVDADIILPAEWLVRAAAALHGHAAVGGTAVPDGDAAYLQRRFGLAPRPVDHSISVTGSNALYRREVFKLTAFDATLREGEDSALNHAMSRAGLSCATVPGLLVQHAENKNLRTSLRWLFDVGRGATRQLVTYREVRGPDLAAGAFVAAVVTGSALVTRGRLLVGLAVPTGLVLLASTQHVRSRFRTPPAQWPRVLAAIAVDSALLTAYFTGRVVGVTALLPPRAAPAARG
jgi:GT2 family glycosyltransferase